MPPFCSNLAMRSRRVWEELGDGAEAEGRDGDGEALRCWSAARRSLRERVGGWIREVLCQKVK